MPTTPTQSDSSARRVEQLLALLQLDTAERRRELERIRQEEPLRAAALDTMLAQGMAARTEGLLAETGARSREGLPPGTWVGPYQIQRVLGRGGMGTVYLAQRFEPYRQDVALKLMHPGLSGHLKSRFHAERQILASLTHPGIVHLIDGDDDAQGTPYLVMEYVEGEQLGDHCRAIRATPDTRVRLLHAVAETLAFAHSRGVVHRDLKPSNILVDRSGRPRVTDFGLAKLALAPAEKPEDALTAAGLLLGTPAYMAPERLAYGPGRDDPGVDVYALGVTLFLLLTDRLPFSDHATRDGPAQAIQAEAPLLRRLRPSLPRDLETIVAKALARDPRDRFADAGALAEQLGRYLAGETLTIHPPTRFERMTRWSVRHRRPLLAWAASFALALMVMTGLLVTWNRDLRSKQAAIRATMRSLWLSSTSLVELLPLTDPWKPEGFDDLTRSFSAIRDDALVGDDPVLDRQLAVLERQFAESLSHMGLRNGEISKFVEAVPHLDRSISLLRPLPAKAVRADLRAWTEFDLFRALIVRTNVLESLGYLDAALRDSDEALRIIRGLASRFPDEPARLEAEARHLLGRRHLVVAFAGRKSDLSEINTAFDLARRSVVLAGPQVDAVKLNTLFMAQNEMAARLIADPIARERVLREACETAERLEALPGEGWLTDSARPTAMVSLAEFLLFVRGQPIEALRLAEPIEPAVARLIDRDPENIYFQDLRTRLTRLLSKCREVVDVEPEAGRP